VLLVTDPVWRATVLEEDAMLQRLRVGLANRWVWLRVVEVDELQEEAGRDTSLGDSFAGTRVAVLSPGFSGLAGELAERFPDTAFVVFGPGPLDSESPLSGQPASPQKVITVYPDITETLRRAGSCARNYVERRSAERRRGSQGGEAPRLAIVTLSAQKRGGDADGNESGIEEAAGEGEVDAFEGGWLQGSENADMRAAIQEVSIRENDAAERLRSEGIGSADFVFVRQTGGGGRLASVLSTLEDWNVPSFVRGPYAEEAYPGTVVLEMRYDWPDAVYRAVEKVLQAGEGGTTRHERQTIPMGGVLRPAISCGES
jgi:hypothetical protein